MPNASPQQPTLLHPGQVFDRYTAERLLGHGGMGEVWLVRHNILQVHRALKLLLPDVAVKDSTQIDRFLREAKLACRLKHPNLIEVHDAGYSELADASGRTVGVYYIFMDYVSGGSLGERLRAGHRPSLAETLSIMRQVASALEAAEASRMVHRDIKPDNIMFAADGSIKLADLGIAKSTQDQDDTLTMTAAVFGTPAYMVPEQAHDASKVDIRADIYSLGCVTFEMLTGQRPYQGRTAMELLAQVIADKELPDVRESAPDVPPAVARLVADLCAKDRDKRIQHPAEVVSRIESIQAEM
ncbi:MAG: serine/threonine protein kinase, partial [Victivallales bacterium]|nr:serine/threonine protein kinase [Victivallales bacterium]